MVDVVIVIPKYVMKNITIAQREREDEEVNNLQLDPPLHATYLAASLEQEGFSVKILDETLLALKQKTYDLADHIQKEHPRCVGIHVHSFALARATRLIKALRERCDALIVIGGPHVSFDPSSAVELGADYGLRGECERSFPLLLKTLHQGQDPSGIPGLVRKVEGVTVANPPDVIPDLDALPFPARHLLPVEDYYIATRNGKVATILTSRGCLYRCIFCASPSKTIRMRSPENIVKEIGQLVAEGYDLLRMQDDLFTFDRERVKTMCRLLIEKDIQIKWDCTTRADCLDPEMLSLMKEAGCYLIFCGVETGNERIRNAILRKGVTNKRLQEGFRMIKEAGIQAGAYTMLGHPTETLQDMEETIKFVLRLDPDYADFTLTTLIPGTAIFERALQEGKVSVNEWTDITQDKKYILIYVPDGVTLAQMQQMQRKAFFRFYYRPRVIWREIKGIRTLQDFAFRVKRAVQLFSYFPAATSSAGPSD